MKCFRLNVHNTANDSLKCEWHHSPQHSNGAIPAFLEVPKNVEDEFIRCVLSKETHRIQFRLTPAFVIYMAARHRIARNRADLSGEHCSRDLWAFFLKVAERFRIIIQDYDMLKEVKALWLANISELLNIMKQDVDLSVMTIGTPQEILLRCVEHCFNLLSMDLKERIHLKISPFINTKLDDRAASGELVSAMEEIMRLLRRSRLNAALTIQLFSQLFHFINARIFNWLVSPAGEAYCSTAFGVRLHTRFEILHTWAEHQGLELAAECHMDRIQQAITLLITPKTMDNITSLGVTCYKLNSVQVRYLLEHIVLDVGEEAISDILIDNVARIAITQADEMAAQDGMSVQLEEESELCLPFVLPQDGYSSELLHGIPPSMTDFIFSLQNKGLCVLLPQLHSSGSWIVNFHPTVQDSRAFEAKTNNDTACHSSRVESNVPVVWQQSNLEIRSVQPTVNTFQHQNYAQNYIPEIVNITFNRGNGGIGLSIVAAQGIGERTVGIYVKKVVDGGVAQRDGRLESGDQLLSVNNQSLIGISQEQAAAKMTAAGPVVSFKVKKQAARYNGLSECLANEDEKPTYNTTSNYRSDYSISLGDNFGNIKKPHIQHQFSNSTDMNRYEYNKLITANPTRCENRGSHMNSSNLGNSITGLRISSPFNNNDLGSELQEIRSASASELYQNHQVASTTSLSSLPPQNSSSTFVSNTPNNACHHRGIIPKGMVRPVIVQPPSRLSPLSRDFRYNHSPSLFYQSIPTTSDRIPCSECSPSALNQSSIMGATFSSPTIEYANLPLIEDCEHSNISVHSADSHELHSCRDSFAFYTGPLIAQPQSTLFTDAQQSAINSPSAQASFSSSECKITSFFPSSSISSQIVLTAPQDSVRLSDFMRQISPYSSIAVTKLQQHASPHIPSLQSSSDVCFSEPQVFFPSSRRDELNEQLDRLEAIGAAMTEQERKLYRQLVNELARIREPLNYNLTSQIALKTNANVNDDVNRFLNWSVSNQSPSIDSIRPTNSSSSQSVHSQQWSVSPSCSPTDLPPAIHLQRPEHLILTNKANWDANSPTQKVICHEASNRISKMIEGKHQIDELDIKSSQIRTNANESLKTKKGVQWEDKVEVETSERNKSFIDEEINEPRVQILGKQEVYRDPRQRRLIEILAKQNTAQSQIDRANPGFRDKMKLFAEQIGEKTPKNRLKASSAEREIEQIDENFI